MRRNFELNGDAEYADNGHYDRLDDFISTRTTHRGNLMNHREPAALRMQEIDTSATAWQTNAACRGMNVELFFGDDAATREMASFICEDCPVRAMCFDYAATNKEQGTWGGTYRGTKA